MTRKRRGRGEGSVYQRADGTWCAILSVGYDESGRRRRRFVYGDTKKAVQEKLRELQNDAPDAATMNVAKLRFGDFLDRYLDDVAKPKVRASTLSNYRRVARLYIRPQIGGAYVANVSALSIVGMMSAMASAGKSAHLRRLAYIVTSLALDQAVAWKLIRSNPAASVEAPQVASKEITVVTPDELALILKAAVDDRFEALIVLAVATGLRQGELLGLQWPCVDLERGTLRVAWSLSEVDGVLSLTEPKSKKSRRTIALPAMAIEALAEHRKRQMAAGHAASSYVFTNRHGGPLRRSHFRDECWKPLLERAGIEGLTFHGLRHCHASMLLHAGVGIKLVSSRLGHSKAGFTLDRYAHLIEGAESDAAAKIETVMRSAKKSG